MRHYLLLFLIAFFTSSGKAQITLENLSADSVNVSYFTAYGKPLKSDGEFKGYMYIIDYGQSGTHDMVNALQRYRKPDIDYNFVLKDKQNAIWFFNSPMQFLNILENHGWELLSTHPPSNSAIELTKSTDDFTYGKISPTEISVFLIKRKRKI